MENTENRVPSVRKIVIKKILWQASHSVKGQNVLIGTFDTKEEAQLAYAEVRAQKKWASAQRKLDARNAFIAKEFDSCKVLTKA